jgi:hypothetical protein
MAINFLKQYNISMSSIENGLPYKTLSKYFIFNGKGLSLKSNIIAKT